HVYNSARMSRADAVPTADLLRRLDASWKVALVGDGAMHPAELLDAYGGIDPRVTTETPGVVWLQRIAGHFERAVWINPEPPKARKVVARRQRLTGQYRNDAWAAHRSLPARSAANRRPACAHSHRRRAHLRGPAVPRGADGRRRPQERGGQGNAVPVLRRQARALSRGAVRGHGAIAQSAGCGGDGSRTTARPFARYRVLSPRAPVAAPGLLRAAAPPRP